MSEEFNDEEVQAEEKMPKKVSLAEAMKKKLAEKKQEQAKQNSKVKGPVQTKKLETQHRNTTKSNRRKMGM